MRSRFRRLEEHSVGEATRAKSYRLLHAIFVTAVDDLIVRRNPCRIRNGGKESSPERVELTLTEVYAIAEAVPKRYRLLILFGAFTSLRFGELAALQWCDIDADVVTVRNAS